MRSTIIHGRRAARGAAALVTLFGALGAGTAVAFEFQNSSGNLTGSWDTTLSYGQSTRVTSRDCRLIAIANGGCGYSPNFDDGDINYPTGVFSRAYKITSELSLKYAGFGAFVRGSGLYDAQVMDDSTQRTPLSHDAKALVGSYTRLLDAFVYDKFDLGSMPAELRLGRQVVSWGESTFIQGGLNTINPYDVSALREPGAELKEGFLPEQMAVLNVQFNKTFSGQAVLITRWHPTMPDPAGSYFSTNDFATPGGSKVVFGFGGLSDQGVNFSSLGGALAPNFQSIPRLPDHNPPNSGQFGFNVKMYLPDFNNGTEFGLYFLNYHSRLPVVSGVTGTSIGVANAWGAITAAGGAAQALAAGLPLQAAIATAAAAAVQASRSNALGYVGNLSLATATQYATIGANTSLAGGNVAAQAQSLATNEYAQTGGYFVEYPKNIRMIGLSFNTQLQSSGIALQGEFSYRKDVPLQYDDVELLFAALTPFEQGIGTLRAPPGQFALPPCSVQTPSLSKCNQLGSYAVSQVVRGYELHDMWQFQFTATKSFANILHASQMIMLLEAAVDHVNGFEDKLTGGPNGQGLRYEASGTFVSGNAPLAFEQFNQLEPQGAFADATSWGYRFVTRLEYPNLIGSWNVLPRLAWQQDVKGTSPGPGGNFIEGRTELTVGVGADLRSKWDLDLAWTTYAGAGAYNLLRDRDYISAAIKYSF